VTYRSVNSDILNEFLIPCLQNSVLYKRAVGYFTSASLAEAARGLVGLVQNGGRMLLVASPRLTEEDIEKIKKGYDVRETIESALLRDIQIPLSEIDSARVRNLTWMIATNKLDIRIVRPWDLTGTGIYHEKIGIFYDSFDEESSDKIAFCGSMNETPGGLISNYESIDVSISWDKAEREHQRVLGHVRHFNNLWEGKEAGLETFEFPEAVRRQLLQRYSPSVSDREPGGRRRLRSYQEQAVNSWIKADRSGVVSMATGAGKTLVALKCLETCPQPFLSIIVVPSMDLAKQWLDEIRVEYPNNSNVREAFSEEPSWPSKVKNLINAFLDFPGAPKRSFIITTIQTASKERFRSLITEIPSDKTAIIVDEVHHSGAPEFSNVFEIKARYRLGLSATPERAWDEIGNQVIFDYFGPPVFEYDISDAIRDGVLTPYQYLLHPVALTYEERQRFKQISHQIAATLGAARSRYPNLKLKSIPEVLEFLSRVDKELGTRLRNLYLTRVGLVKKADTKKDALREIVRNYELKRCLVYCNDLEHLEECRRIIFDEGYEAMEFSSDVDANERTAVKESFARETTGNKFLVAVRCLDEGVDLPVCDSAILISCSRSTREFIQRRGRVLRRHPSKDISTIHDILVLPFTKAEDAYALSPSEYDFVDAELRRAEEFSKNALNRESIRIDELRALFRRYPAKGA
jgi:superfamily II DNA or RNA helicase